jgi:hypothetical protein
MGIFDVFKKGKSQDKGEQPKPEGKYMPQSKLPIDERFMKYFIENGGKFIYCENQDEVLDAFDNILLENDWYESEVCCLSNHFTQKFDGFNLEFNTNESSKFYLGGCEYLIANNGALLVTSNQIKEKKTFRITFKFCDLSGY